MEYICRYCGKICKNDNSLRNHERLCKLNPNRQEIKSNFIEWNKKRKEEGIKGENHYTKAKRLGLEKPTISEETREKLKNVHLGKSVSAETKKKISNTMKESVKNNPDLYNSIRKNCKVKIYEYNGEKLNGKWELEFAKYLDNNDIEWTRPKDGIEYEYENSTHFYYPDFYLPKYNIFIEIKGYVREKDYYKWAAVQNLIIIKKKDIKEIINNTFDLLGRIPSVL